MLLAPAPPPPPLATAARVTRSDHVTAAVRKRSQHGNRLLYVGTAHSHVFGSGHIVEHATIQGLGSVGTFSIGYRGGTVRGHSRATGRAHANLTVSFSGTYRFTGGTGTYRNISGSGRFSGSGPLNLSSATFHQHGTVSY